MSVCIVGAGLAGTMMAAMLSKLGFQVTVYEKRPDWGVDDAKDKDKDQGSEAFGLSQSAAKRSINLALSQRGMEALAAVDLLDTAMQAAIAMPCRVIHQANSPVAIKQAYGKPHEAIHSVSRQLLNELLLKKTRGDPASNVQFRFGYSLVSCDKAGACVFRKVDDASSASRRNPSPGDGNKKKAGSPGRSGSSSSSLSSTFSVPSSPSTPADVAEEDEIHARYDLVIGADGAYSNVRESMLKLGRVNFSRQYIGHGYKELSIPPRIAADGSPTFALDDHQGLHIWPRGEFMLIALPNPDCSFTATLFAPYSGTDGFNSIDANDPAAVRGYFSRHFPDVLPLMPEIADDFRLNPIGSLVTIRVDPWKQGPMVLLGDAAHAVVPFYGQGMNAAFEDCLILYLLIQKRLVDNLVTQGKTHSGLSSLLHSAAEEFAQTRMPAGNALADLCIAHYSDMAASTASTWYLLEKKAEALLHWAFPASFVPLYTMVAFTRTPYHEAVARAERQERAARTLLAAVTASMLAVGAGVAAHRLWWK